MMKYLAIAIVSTFQCRWANGRLGIYPIKHRRTQAAVTKKISLAELPLHEISYSEDSPSKAIPGFILTLFETDGQLPFFPSVFNVEMAMQDFVEYEVNAAFGPFSQLKKVHAQVVAQKSTVSSRRNRALQMSGSELEIELNVTFANEPSPDLSDVDMMLKLAMQNMKNFLSNLTSRAIGDAELQNVHSAFRLELTGDSNAAGREPENNGGLDPGATGSIVDGPAAESTDSNLIVPLIFAFCAATILTGFFLIRRKDPNRLENANSSGSEPDFLGTNDVGIYWDEESDLFSFETALLDAPNEKSPRVRIVPTESNVQHDLYSNITSSIRIAPIRSEDRGSGKFEGGQYEGGVYQFKDVPLDSPTGDVTNLIEQKLPGAGPRQILQDTGSDVMSNLSSDNTNSDKSQGVVKSSRSIFSFFSQRTSATAKTVPASNQKGKKFKSGVMPSGMFGKKGGSPSNDIAGKQTISPESRTSSVFIFSDEEGTQKREEGDSTFTPETDEQGEISEILDGPEDSGSTKWHMEAGNTQIKNEEARQESARPREEGNEAGRDRSFTVLNDVSATGESFMISSLFHEQEGEASKVVGEHPKKVSVQTIPAVSVSENFAADVQTPRSVPFVDDNVSSREKPVKPSTASSLTSFNKVHNHHGNVSQMFISDTESSAETTSPPGMTQTSNWSSDILQPIRLDKKALSDSQFNKSKVELSEEQKTFSDSKSNKRSESPILITTVPFRSFRVESESPVTDTNRSVNTEAELRKQSLIKVAEGRSDRKEMDTPGRHDWGVKLRPVTLADTMTPDSSIHNNGCSNSHSYQLEDSPADSMSIHSGSAYDRRKQRHSKKVQLLFDKDDLNSSGKKGRRHTKSTVADGSTNYQNEAMDPQDWSVTTDEDGSVDSTDVADATPMKAKRKQQPSSHLKSADSMSTSVLGSVETPSGRPSTGGNLSLLSSGTSGRTTVADLHRGDSETTTNKQLISDLVWLEKKIAAAKDTVVSSPESDVNSREIRERHRELQNDRRDAPPSNDVEGEPSRQYMDDSLSFRSADRVHSNNDSSLNSTSILMDSRDQSRDQHTYLQGLQTILCRDCYAPPGKLKIVIHSTKDGPSVHTVKPGSALEGHIFPGDLIISVDDVDTRSYTAEQVMKMMTARARYERKITVLHFEEGEEL